MGIVFKNGDRFVTNSRSPDTVNTSDLSIALVSIMITAFIWVFAQPVFNTAVIASIGVLAFVCIFLKRSAQILRVEQASSALIVIGCSLEIAAIFPERTLFIIIMAGVVLWFANCFFKRRQPAHAWLSITLGLMTAPLTELHLERNLWTLAACMIGMFHLIKTGRVKITASKRMCFSIWSWILLTLLTFSSSFWSAYPYASFRFTGILIFNLFVFIQVAEAVYHKQDRRRFISMLLSFAGVYVLASFAAFFHRVSGLGWSYATGFRIYVFERHPNYAIFFLLMSLPLWLLTINTKKLKPRIVSIVGLLAALVYLVFLSYSRQGYILLTIMLVSIPFLYQRTLMKRMFWGLIAIGTAGFGSLFLASAPLRNRLISTVDLSGSLRFNAWKVFIDLIREQPLLGYGMDTARYIYPKALGYIRPLEPPTRQFLFEAHNAYIDVLTGVGIIGLVIFVFFIGICTLSSPKKRSFEGRIALLMGVSLWVDLFFNFRIHAQDTSVYLMVFFAFTAVVHARHTIQTTRRRLDFKPLSVYLLVTLAILFCAPPWLGKHWVTQAQRQLRFQNWPQIYSLFNRAALVEPLNAHPQYYLGLCYKNMNQPNAALERFRHSVKLCPNYPFYRFHLAIELVEHNRISEAAEHLEIAASLDPYDTDGRVQFNLGILQWRLGYQDKARRNFWTTIVLNPTYINDSYWIHDSFLKEQLTEELMSFTGSYYTWNVFSINNLRFLPAIATALYNAGYDDEAHRLRVSAALNFPFHVDSLHDTILFLLEQKRYDISKNIVYYALNHHVDCPHLLNYLALIYLKTDNYTMARFCAERSLRFWSEYAVDNFAAYQVLKEVGRQTDDDELFRRYTRPVDYLSDGRHKQQTSDLVIHIGLNAYLVRSVEIITSQTE
jgi:O-antigen ligase/tetratricopeptide (TPR) repeat protein